MTPLRQNKPVARTSLVRELHPRGGADAADAALVRELRAGSAAAAAALFDRHGGHVERLLWSVLGPEPESEDVLHEVFVRALEGIGSVDDPSRLRSWLTGITVYTAREWIRRRARRRWLSFVADVPELSHIAASEEVNEATRCTFEVLRGMTEDDRIFFSLRFIEGMELAEIALTCDVSLSTAKRRVKEASARFVARARRHEALTPWLEEGRWATEPS